MKLITALDEGADQSGSVFLAGGITGCPDWQSDLAMLLADTTLVLFNPRRAHFPIDDPGAAPIQIAWEHRHLRSAEAISFWFPSDTLCPIVLYELGAWSMTRKPLFVGAHPAYERRRDVIEQTRLARPDVVVVSALNTLAAQIRAWAQSRRSEESEPTKVEDTHHR